MANQPAPGPWNQGEPYERYVGRWSRRVAPLFLDWLAAPADRDWLDVGCGTGALCGAILDRCSPRSVSGVEPSDGFRETATRKLSGRATLHPGNATAIPLGDSSVDIAVSGLVMNFVPDQPAALREMARICRDGGTIAAYVWDYAEGMEMMRHFWTAAVSLDPAAATLDESPRFPVCLPGGLANLMRGGGLVDVESTAIEIQTVFADFDDYWQPFLGGTGPAPAYAATLDEEERKALSERIREGLPVASDGSITLLARAWAARGRVAK